MNISDKSMSKRSGSHFPGAPFILLLLLLLFCCCWDYSKALWLPLLPCWNTGRVREAQLTCWGSLPPEPPPSPTAQSLAHSKCSFNGRSYLYKHSLDRLKEASSVR